MKPRNVLCAAAILSALITTGAPVARAQNDADATARLRQAIEPAPAPHIDTVLVFTNLGNSDLVVGMKAWTSSGEAVGSKQVKVPGNGLAYVLASELAEENGVEHFVGKVEARAAGRVTGSALLVGGPLTDLPALNQIQRLRVAANTADAAPAVRVVSHVTFPAVASY